MAQSAIFKGTYKDTCHGIPFEIEWELPIDTNFQTFEAIANEVRRIAYTLRRAEKQETKRRRQLALEELALQNLRWLFLTPLEVTVDGKPKVEQLRLGGRKKVKLC